VLSQTAPFDHCNMTMRAGVTAALTSRFRDLLLSMDYGDPEVRPLLDLEGLKCWKPGRTSGYDALEGAVDRSGFYDPKGAITAAGYRP
jgi:ABC-type phosphate/phosphonate transport system substrate-binding protein